MTNILLRRAEPHDAGALSRFAARLFRETYEGCTAPVDLDAYIDESFHIGQQRAKIIDPFGIVFLASQGGNANAICGYVHVIAQASDERLMLLNRIYIERECRGTGLAGRLLDTIRTECRRRRIAKLRLTVFEKNARAIAFYSRNGFVLAGETIFKVGGDAQRDLEMELAIDLN